MSATYDELVVPLRDCTPWCGKGDGHGDEHPEDRDCWSEYQVVPLSRHQASHYTDGKWLMAFLNVYLRREMREDEPLVFIHNEETDKELRLTMAEARDLRDTIDALLTLGGNP